MRSSLVPMPPGCRMIILRQPYLALTGDLAAALLLDILVYHTDRAYDMGWEPYLKLRYGDFLAQAMGLLKQHDVKRGLRLLSLLGYIDVQVIEGNGRLYHVNLTKLRDELTRWTREASLYILPPIVGSSALVPDVSDTGDQPTVNARAINPSRESSAPNGAPKEPDEVAQEQGLLRTSAPAPLATTQYVDDARFAGVESAGDLAAVPTADVRADATVVSPLATGTPVLPERTTPSGLHVSQGDPLDGLRAGFAIAQAIQRDADAALGVRAAARDVPAGVPQHLPSQAAWAAPAPKGGGAHRPEPERFPMDESGNDLSSEYGSRARVHHGADSATNLELLLRRHCGNRPLTDAQRRRLDVEFRWPEPALVATRIHQPAGITPNALYDDPTHTHHEEFVSHVMRGITTAQEAMRVAGHAHGHPNKESMVSHCCNFIPRSLQFVTNKGGADEQRQRSKRRGPDPEPGGDDGSECFVR